LPFDFEEVLFLLSFELGSELEEVFEELFLLRRGILE
jgi:hypothetical protein